MEALVLVQCRILLETAPKDDQGRKTLQTPSPDMRIANKLPTRIYVPGSSSDEPLLCMLASQHVFLRAATPVGCLSLTCSSRLHLIGGLRHSHHTMPTLDGRQLLRFYSLLESETSRAQHTRSSGGDRKQPDKVPFLKYPSTLVFLHGAIVAYQRLGLHFTHFLLGEYHPSFLLLWASPLSRVLTL
ncbi:hypothetical protein CMEL01_03156 [Colletotrichum melonis]|uniref:Uncharacterized protein n=1 Tax=Colletotrichum melonis TaxID=1209925 RepID=A0AAI9UML1_9PEZI|nr:hypothetical protein CMEL01_03156 [Colletotrichum melonis]